jgi:uncharacterized protein (DUF433 family)
MVKGSSAGIASHLKADPTYSDKESLYEALIERDNETLGGTSVFAGTRVPVAVLFENLAAGLSMGEILDSYPTLKREQAIEALGQAKILLCNSIERPARNLREDVEHNQTPSLKALLLSDQARHEMPPIAAMQVERVSTLPPPHGFASWLDYVVASSDVPRSVNIESLFGDTEISREEVRAAIKDELDALRRQQI